MILGKNICNSVVGACIVLLTASCFKRDNIITLPPATGSSVNQVSGMGPSGDTTIFYNLKENKIVKKSLTFCWDLCFESNTSTNAVFMNGGKGIKMYNTHETNFVNVDLSTALAVTSENWHCDKPSLLPSTSYIGDWLSKDEIYIVKLDNSNNNFIKLKIKTVNDNAYTIEYADVKETTVFTTQQIIKNKTNYYTYFSFSSGIVNDFEPDYTTWDLELTQYAYIYEDLNNFIYNVKGVLLNPYNTLGYGDTTKEVDFSTVDLAYAQNLPLTKNRDVIGYLWKKLPSISGNYIVNDKYLYLVQTQKNELYKLHFIGYYSTTGESHCPKFEFERLK